MPPPAVNAVPTRPARCWVSEELAFSPGSGPILERLSAGHEPDGHGWCRHAAHAHRWDRHPCAVLRFVALVGETSDRPRTRP